MIIGMSRIYFHAPHRTAEVGGSERAYFGELARCVALGVLGPLYTRQTREWLEPLLVGRSYSFREDYWELDFGMWFGGMDRGGVRVGDHVVGVSELALNTLVAMNSPQLSFVAHVHGCCENHGWVEAENARWLSDLVLRGREDNLFRAGQGWEDVATLAQEVAETCEGPIVMSYSVCESFPNPAVANWTPADEGDEGGDAWYALSADAQWDMGVRALRESDWPFAMGPDRQRQGFLSGHSVFDLLATRWTGQLAPR